MVSSGDLALTIPHDNPNLNRRTASPSTIRQNTLELPTASQAYDQNSLLRARLSRAGERDGTEFSEEAILGGATDRAR